MLDTRRWTATDRLGGGPPLGLDPRQRVVAEVRRPDRAVADRDPDRVVADLDRLADDLAAARVDARHRARRPRWRPRRALADGELARVVADRDRLAHDPPLRGSMRVTVSSPAFATHTEPRRRPRRAGRRPTAIGSPSDVAGAGSRRVTVPSVEARDPDGALADRDVERSPADLDRAPVDLRREAQVDAETVPSPAFVTQTSRSPTASASGARPTGIRVDPPVLDPHARRRRRRRPTQTTPSATTGLSGWRADGRGRAPARDRCSRVEALERACAGVGDPHVAARGREMPSGPAAGADRRRHLRHVGGSLLGLLGLGGGGAAALLASGPETNWATAMISAAERRPSNEGIVPPTAAGRSPRTRSALGLGLVEVRARWSPVESAARERVAAAAAGGGEDLRARTAAAPPPRAAAAAGRGGPPSRRR